MFRSQQPRELKTLVVALKKLVVPVSGGGFQGGGGPYTAVALRQNSRENQHLVSGIGLERKQSGLYQKRKQLKTSEKPRVLPRAVWNCKKKQAFNSVRHTQFLMVCYDLS